MNEQMPSSHGLPPDRKDDTTVMVGMGTTFSVVHIRHHTDNALRRGVHHGNEFQDRVGPQSHDGSARPSGNIRCATLWLTIATGSLPSRSASLKSRPSRIGRPSVAKNPGEMIRTMRAGMFLARRRNVPVDRETWRPKFARRATERPRRQPRSERRAVHGFGALLPGSNPPPARAFFRYASRARPLRAHGVYRNGVWAASSARSVFTNEPAAATSTKEAAI